MNIKEKLLNKKKKLLAYATIATLGGSVLTGCDEFAYNKDVNGGIEVTGTISYDAISNLMLVRLSNSVAKKDEYIIAEQYHHYFGRTVSNQKYYHNIENDTKIYDDYEKEKYENFTLTIIVDNLYDYLYKYDMVKEEYSIEDIIKLKENLLNDPDLNIKKDENKQLVK